MSNEVSIIECYNCVTFNTDTAGKDNANLITKSLMLFI
jgi:hypothetical protein